MGKRFFQKIVNESCGVCRACELGKLCHNPELRRKFSRRIKSENLDVEVSELREDYLYA